MVNNLIMDLNQCFSVKLYMIVADTTNADGTWLKCIEDDTTGQRQMDEEWEGGEHACF
jgi:hypothetical protein